MNKCPYCGKEMKNGFVEGDGRQSLIWVEEDQKRNIVQDMFDKKCIVIEKAGLFHKTHVKASYCIICKKIIIALNN